MGSLKLIKIFKKTPEGILISSKFVSNILQEIILSIIRLNSIMNGKPSDFLVDSKPIMRYAKAYPPSLLSWAEDSFNKRHICQCAGRIPSTT